MSRKTPLTPRQVELTGHMDAQRCIVGRWTVSVTLRKSGLAEASFTKLATNSPIPIPVELTVPQPIECRPPWWMDALAHAVWQVKLATEMGEL